MNEDWTRLPGGGWLREFAGGAVVAAEADCDGRGYSAVVQVRGRTIWRSAPGIPDAPHAAGVAVGWLLAMTEAKAGEGGA